MAIDGENVDEAVVVDDGFITVKFVGDRYTGAKLPLDSLSTLVEIQSLLGELVRDAYLDTNPDRRRMTGVSRHAIDLVLANVEDGSAIARLALAVTLTSTNVPAVLEARTRFVVTASELAAGKTSLSYPTTQDRLKKYSAILSPLKAAESLTFSYKDQAGVLATSTVTAAQAESIAKAAKASTSRSFFVTGALKRLDAAALGVVTLRTTLGEVPVKCSMDHQRTVSKAWSENPDSVFAFSGVGAFDDSGRIRKVEHVTDLSVVDRPFDLDGRIQELRKHLSPTLSETGKALGLVRLERMATAIPKVVHSIGVTPDLFIDDEGVADARWTIGEWIVNVSFETGETQMYAYNAGSEEYRELSVQDSEEVLPAWSIIEFIGGVNEQS